MDEHQQKTLRWILIFVMVAVIFGAGTLYGIFLTFHKGSDYIAEEVDRRHMSFEPFREYLEAEEGGDDSAATEDPAATESHLDAYGRLNINTATVAELQQLPGIGAAKAQAIIDFRNQYGLFNDKEDLLLVEGIGESIYKSIEPYIVVN